MMRSPTRTIGTAVASLVVAAFGGVAGCRSRSVPMPVPASPADVRPAAAATPAVTTPQADSARRGYGEADVRFMHHMIHHHAQALEMTALVPARTSRENLRMLARRIEVSQRDEIGLMRRWLQDHHEMVPPVGGAEHEAKHDMHQMHHDSAGHRMPTAGMTDAQTMQQMMQAMPGMLSAEEMTRLAGASGVAFERLFLQDMIRHHEGAVKMVAELFATPGAGQNAEIFRFAADVDADQRAEIARMKALLAKLQG